MRTRILDPLPRRVCVRSIPLATIASIVLGAAACKSNSVPPPPPQNAPTAGDTMRPLGIPDTTKPATRPPTDSTGDGVATPSRPPAR